MFVRQRINMEYIINQRMSQEKFRVFMDLHKDLMGCYAETVPVEYKLMSLQEQKEFCFQQRRKVEDLLIKDRVSLSDFFAAARQQA